MGVELTSDEAAGDAGDEVLVCADAPGVGSAVAYAVAGEEL
jgi:hypothetical protein